MVSFISAAEIFFVFFFFSEASQELRRSLTRPGNEYFSFGASSLTNATQLIKKPNWVIQIPQILTCYSHLSLNFSSAELKCRNDDLFLLLDSALTGFYSEYLNPCCIFNDPPFMDETFRRSWSLCWEKLFYSSVTLESFILKHFNMFREGFYETVFRRCETVWEWNWFTAMGQPDLLWMEIFIWLLCLLLTPLALVQNDFQES